MTDASPRRRAFLICLGLALVTAGVYAPVRHFEFVNYDDPLCVTENRHVQAGLTWPGLAWAFTTLDDQWMPVTWSVRLLEGQSFGLNAGAHHVVNVLFHAANVLLLFGVLRRMTAAPWRSAVVAALFAVHPLHVESVAWVTGLKDVLSMFFGLLTIWAYARYVEQINTPRSTLPASRFPLHVYYYALTLFLFALALMAKPMMVTLPFVLLLLDYWPLGRTRWAEPAPTKMSRPATGVAVTASPGRLLWEKLPFFGLTAASCVVTYWAQRRLGAVVSLETVPLGIRIANALRSYVGYLDKAVWPRGLAVFYPLDMNVSLGPTIIAGLGLTAVTAVVMWRARREPWLATGWLWYLGTLAPVIGLVQVGVTQAMADRYTYIPLVGPFITLAWAIPNSLLARRAQRIWAAALAAVVLGFYAVLCRVQVWCWKDSETLFRHALQVTNDNCVAHNSLGLALWTSGETTEALEHYQEALRINPYFAEAHNNLAFSLFKLGKVSEAIDQFGQALRIKPDYPEAHYNMGLALSQVDRPQEAIKQFEDAVRIKSDYFRAHNNMGVALAKVGKPQAAIKQYVRALQIEPNYPEAQNNLAWLLATLPPAAGGDPARAVTLAQSACKLGGSGEPSYLDTLAAAYAGAGRFNDAVATAEKAIELARSTGQAQVAEQIATRLELYRDGRAYRLPPVPVPSESSDAGNPASTVR